MSGKIEPLQNYILITPCKNEGRNLTNLIDSISSQTIRPILWVILDDGSTDNTPKVIEYAKKRNPWIKSIRFDESVRDVGLHLADVMRQGFDYAISSCKENSKAFIYLGNVDGDLTLPCTFFSNLMQQFENNPKLGIASGGTNHIIGDNIIHAKLSVDEPSGGHMLIRKECFFECGGIPQSYAADSVLKAKARLRGWETKRFEDNIVVEIRDVGSAQGYWKGHIKAGKGAYFINRNPMHILAKSVLYVFKKSWVAGVAYTLGYFGALIKREKQIDDKEIKKYFWNKWRQYL